MKKQPAEKEEDLDNELRQSKQIEYDLAERPCTATIRDLDDGSLIYRTTLKYDSQNRMERFSEQIGRSSHRTGYRYDRDNRTTEITYDSAARKLSYTYDSLGRIRERKLKDGPSLYTTGYTYVDGTPAGSGGNTRATTPLVRTITQGTGDNAFNFEYTYDSRGNITSETRNGQITRYEYDEIGELIGVSDPHEGVCWEYEYDRGGNIIGRKRYDREADGTRGSLQYCERYIYGNQSWRDMLTRVIRHDEQAGTAEAMDYTYNCIGNLVNDGKWTYEWQAGRQLSAMERPLTEAEYKTCNTGSSGTARVIIDTTGSNVLPGNADTVTLTAGLMDGDTEIGVPSSSYVWKRTINGTEDEAWNTAHRGMRSITVTGSEFTDTMNITCTVMAQADYGTISVAGTAAGTADLLYTTGTANGSDRFYTDGCNLMVETDRDANPYSITAGKLMINSDVPAADIISSVKLYRTAPTMRVEFRYNADGLRTQKKILIGGAVSEVYDYTLHGKLITHLTKRSVKPDGSEGVQEMHFFYDAQSRPAVVEYNGEKYQYIHNLQGDVVGIVDSSGVLAAGYRYDAWGHLWVIDGTLSDTLGKCNFFRYRGYVYDEESGLYHLRSRYYNTDNARFMHADVVNDYFIYYRIDNCYSYCNCCPTMYIDDDGFAGKTFDLGQNWFFRIDPAGAGDGLQRHIHVWKKGGSGYSQNTDGSVHDGLSGTPPKWIREKLRGNGKWDWKEDTPIITPNPSYRPSPGPSPNPTPAPAPAPLPSPVPTSNTKKNCYSQVHTSSESRSGAGLIGFIGTCVVVGIKLAASYLTGGMVPAW